VGTPGLNRWLKQGWTRMTRTQSRQCGSSAITARAKLIDKARNDPRLPAFSSPARDRAELT
jgi:hypothetical protein